MRWCKILAAGAAVLLMIYGAQVIAAESMKSAVERPDVILIDGLAALGTLERPGVVFLHDAHTRAAKKLGKDCSACHLKEGDRLSLLYKRTDSKDRKTVMNVYHDNCIACHEEAAGKLEKTGPVICNDCHNNRRQVVSSRQPVGMDRSLHYRHTKAFNKKCETCHHAYDKKKKVLFYDKGKEGSCRYCHGDRVVDQTKTFQTAAHMDCVGCHRKMLDDNKTAGPIQCAGCHDKTAQGKWEKVANPPRMERNQPDATLVKKGEAGMMKRVAFAHRNHEGYTDTCRVCHHKEIAACNSCHTVNGKKEGDFVRLEKALHQIGTDTSCLGCHAQQQAQPQCAGCHSRMKPVPDDRALCMTCHSVPATDIAKDADQKEINAIAAVVLQERPKTVGTYGEKDIPEEVTINSLMDKYEGVKLPHRRIVQKLVAGLGKSQLAARFHTDPGTLCQGCHHNSPASKKPPHCGSCHGKPFDANRLFRPGLKGAYHQQCIGCHDAMGIAKPSSTDCTGCHIERKQW